jgi:hypothetical protein
MGKTRTAGKLCSLESDVRAEGDSEVVVRSVVEIDLISDI